MRGTTWAWALLAGIAACGSPPAPSAATVAPANTPRARHVTLTGRARNVGGRAVLFGTDGKKTPVALPGGWPPVFLGHLVVVEGDLEGSGVPSVDADNATDDPSILVNANAKLLD